MTSALSMSGSSRSKASKLLCSLRVLFLDNAKCNDGDFVYTIPNRTDSTIYGLISIFSSMNAISGGIVMSLASFEA